MIYKVYAIYDCKVEAYMQPFYMTAKGQAIRAFTDSLKDDKSPFGKHPEDYTLFELGSYDDKSAKFDMYATPLSIGKAIEFVS